MDINQSPIVEKLTRKRRFLEVDKEGEKSQLIDESKRIKISADVVKPEKKKSQLRVALEMWYNSCLQSPQTAPREKPKTVVYNVFVDIVPIKILSRAVIVVKFNIESAWDL